jgi:hypothetical protein
MTLRPAVPFARRADRFRTAASLAAILASLAAADGSHAQTSRVLDGTENEAPRRGTSPQSSADVSLEPYEIVVTARRPGQADIASETELSEDEIRARGASSIGELIDGVRPLIGGGSEQPAILVNGRRIGSSVEITGYPPEALDRVAILPPEAAARYGFPAGQRVVNLELKKHFANMDAEAGVTVPTAGGRRGAQLAARRTLIDGNTHWNVQVTAQDETALLKSARRIPVREDALALLPTLQGGEGERIDPNRFESVAGARRSLGVNASMTRPLGAFSLAMNVNANSNDGKQLIGMPIGAIVLPPGSPGAAPTGEAVTTSRLLGDSALQSRQQSESIGASVTLSGPILGWQASLSAFYTHNRSNNAYDRGYDVSAVQRLVDAGDPDFDPYGRWPATPLLTERTRSRIDVLGASFNASRSILTLPAGDVNASLTVNASRNRLRFSSLAGAIAGGRQDRAGSDQVDGAAAFTIPVASRALEVLAPLGDLTLDLSGEVAAATATRTRRKWSAGARWTPLPLLELRASIVRENAEPTFDQLNGPRFEIVTRLFDFAQQEYAQPVMIFGGNPELAGGSVRTLSAGAMIRPFAGDLARLNLGYVRQVARGGIRAFPTLTPDIEAAFPDRVGRDSDGRLVSIDARPINIAHERMESVASGLTLRYTERPKTSGASPAPAGFRPWTFSLSINHNWQLRNETVIRPGLPVLDRLRDGGQPRHNAALNLVAGRAGAGASLDGNWTSAAHVRSGDSMAEFRYAPTFLFNLGLFVEPEQWVNGPDDRNWATGLRISLDVQNVLNGYRNVSARDGDTVHDYARDEIDPLGRTVRLSLQKRF